ncbi:hypothetical protein P4E94_09345 [Pontiellaceae bacterium B12219]|nr:hypothetical protein [Pontiellaceae bacterium B12219]
MMKKASCLAVVGLLAGGATAETVVFKGSSSGDTTGALLKAVKNNPLTTNVYEIAGLNITARSGSDRHKLNATASSNSFGIDDIDVSSPDEHTTRFDFTEHMIVSFDKKLQINAIDFVGFESNSVFVVEVEGQPSHQITEGDLGSYEVYSTEIVVDPGVEIDFYVGNTNSVIGLQSMDITVLDENGEVYLSLETSNSMSYISAEFDGASITNYVIQSSTNLASNVWNTVSGTFSTDTNMSFTTTPYDVQYFRAIAP